MDIYTDDPSLNHGETVVNFDEAFGPILAVDLGEETADPLDGLTTEERLTLNDELRDIATKELGGPAWVHR